MSGRNSSIVALANKSNYLNKKLKYVKNTVITEYDMESAGLNILTELNYFTKQQRTNLLNMDKKNRNIAIGKMLRKNKQMVTDLENGFKEARYIFLEKNNILPSDVLTVKRDAVFIIGQYTIDTNISTYVKIKPKHSYTTYINLLGMEHYYDNDTNLLDVKGYSSESKDILSETLFKFLKNILRFDVMTDKDNIYLKLVEFKDDLLSYSLPKEFYHDPILSGYVIQGNQFNYILPSISEEDKSTVSFNNILKFINELTAYVL